MPPRRAPTHEPSPSSLVRLQEWAGVCAGDPVDVLDDRERGANWTFAAHVTNVATGATWVEVVGGRAGDRRRRSFDDDQLFPHRSLRRGVAVEPPLKDAPRLPLSSGDS
jgi:hypothetical protein